MGEAILSAGGLATLLLEGVKWLLREYVFKDQAYDFPTWFYTVSIPVLTILVQPLLALLGLSGYTMPTDWMEFSKLVVVTLLSSLVALVGYNKGIKPLKEYAVARNKEVG